MFTTKMMAFMNDEEGASGIEYALIAAMVAVVIAGFSTSIRGSILSIFTKISSKLTSAAAA
jgi:pilus assembly protein Flp/PilA